MVLSCSSRCLAIVLLLAPAVTRAQGGLSVWGGLGYSSTEGNVTLGKSAKQVGAQLDLPFVPVAVRGDLVLFGGKYDPDALSYVVSAVLQMRLPIVEPYAIVGRGRYARTLTEQVSGWNYGAGARVGLGRFGIFAEMRRHAAVGRNVTMVGMTF